ncbi:tyrosine-type recombinase/integrase [Deinococcus sp. MIMF12]|uniref:Tyrosine-type recombinase/integrase n=1 Tax=Deinococcus rhizophilus TaxID=3049544 RepID=A0ABT7JGM6_9DEIO|nr:tyrosine-type recombinase/integrase [Deinococcus rhizophilus]MDL2343118.1 tyrosine-type recombinase/integrase [Deinococcus rhizophilus]
MGKIKRGHGEGEYTPLEDGRVRWRVRVTYPDGTGARPSGTARNMTAARAAVAAAKREADAGQRPASKTLTVGEMVREYMGAKAASWAPRTLWNNTALYERHILPHLGARRAAGVRPPDLRAYFEMLGTPRPRTDGQPGKPLGYSGQHQIHVLLSGAYKRAIADGLLRENPAQHARPIRPREDGEAKRKAFKPEDLALFLGAALEDRAALPLAFLAFTGMRLGEALGLRWADIEEDPDAPGEYVARVRRTRSEYSGQHYTGQPKTAKGRRTLPLSADAVALLHDMQRRVTLEAGATGYRGTLGPDSPVFPAADGVPMRQEAARDAMRRTCERAGVPRLSPHALRHSAGTYLISRGADVVSVAAILGHAQASTTLNFYAHALPGKLRTLAYGVEDLRGQSPAKEEAADAPAPRPARKVGGKTRKGGPRR